MTKAILLPCLFLAILLLQGCNSANTVNSVVQMEQISVQPQSADTNNSISVRKKLLADFQKVDFKGISFSYNPQIFGEVKSEEVAEQYLEEATDKPDFVAPQHCLFTFDLSTPFSDMYIAVYPINEFPRMYAVNQSSVEEAKKEKENLRRVLKDKNFRVENQIPYLPFIDAGQAFQAKVKHYNFQSGKGILFLTFWETQVEFPSNRQLRYVFEGITNDGKYYVLAEMPVSVDFLPDDSSEEFEGYKIPWEKLNDKAEMKRFARVKENIGIKLENLPENEVQPNPKYFEEIISSLKIEN